MDREAALPLLLGLFFAIGVHLAAAAALVAVRQVESPEEKAALEQLLIEALEAGPPRIAGEPTDFELRLRHRGARKLDGLSVRVEVAGETVQRRDPAAPVAGASVATSRFRHTVAEPGIHRVRAVARSGDLVAEREARFVWSAPDADDPDLVPFELTVSEPRVAGRLSRVRARVANLGAEVSEPFEVLLLLDGEPIGSHTVYRADAGQERSYTVEQAITVDEPGEHELTVVVDPAEQVAVADRDTTALSRTFTWQEQQVQIGDLRESPVAINWISQEAFEALQALHASRFEQAFVQRESEPDPYAQELTLDPSTARAEPPAPEAPPAAAAEAPTLPESPVEPQQAEAEEPLPPDPRVAEAQRIGETPHEPVEIEDVQDVEEATDTAGEPESGDVVALAPLAPQLSADLQVRPRREEVAGPPLAPDVEATAPPQEAEEAREPAETDARQTPETDSEAEAAEPASGPPPVPEATDAEREEEHRPTAVPRDEREAPPATRITGEAVRPGEVLAREGLRVNTVRPRFSTIAQRSSAPANPRVEIQFDRQGRVLHARILRSSGYDNVDGPILSSLYRWTAEGPLLEEVAERLSVEVLIVLRSD